jgi:hypothetical protein
MTMLHLTTFTQQTLDNFSTKMRERDEVLKLARALFAEEFQEIEDALWQLYTLRSIDAGTGQQLDNIGAKIGLSRNGFGDTDYQRLLYGQTLVNRSRTTVPELNGIFALAAPAGSNIRVDQVYPAALVVRISAQALTLAYVSVLAKFMRESRTGGVLGQLEYMAEGSTSTTVAKFSVAGQGWHQGLWGGVTE